jgi:hypothetical protein
MVLIESAVALQQHMIPGTIEHRRLLLDMKVEILSRRGLQAHVVVEMCLHGEGLEQRRHSADAIAIQVVDRVRPIVFDVRQLTKRKAVTYKQDGRSASR